MPLMLRLMKSFGKTIFCMLIVGHLPSHAKKTLLINDAFNSLSDQELMQLQYYSTGFDLIRPISSASEHRAAGKLITKDGQAYEIITIKAGTPGIATAVSRDPIKISVSFEPNCAIEFVQPGPEAAGRPFILTDAIGGVEYCGFRYWVQPGQRYDVRSLAARHNAKRGYLVRERTYLLVDLQRIEDTKKSKRVAPGRRVGDQ